MSLTNFQKMLSKIAETGEKAIISSKEENKLTAEKTDLKKKLSNTYSSLPSDIDFSATKANKSVPVVEASVQKTKANSYKSLLKMAKSVTPAGLVVKESSTAPNQERSQLERVGSKRETTSSSRPVDNKGHRITSSNPHHPDYRPPVTSNSSIAFLKQPKPRALTSPRPKVRKMNPSKHIPNDLIMLNTKKRDLASVEEIHDELMMRKKKTMDKDILLSKEVVPGRRPPQQQSSRKPVNPTPFKRMEEVPHRSKNSAGISSRAIPAPSKNIKKQTSSDSSLGQYRPKPPKPPTNDYSSVIQEIFGYNRHKYQNDDSDASSDMEVNYRDLEREEKKSLRLGKKEDLEEEMRELAKLKKKQTFHSSRR